MKHRARSRRARRARAWRACVGLSAVTCLRAPVRAVGALERLVRVVAEAALAVARHPRVGRVDRRAAARVVGARHAAVDLGGLARDQVGVVPHALLEHELLLFVRQDGGRVRRRGRAVEPERRRAGRRRRRRLRRLEERHAVEHALVVHQRRLRLREARLRGGELVVHALALLVVRVQAEQLAAERAVGRRDVEVRVGRARGREVDLHDDRVGERPARLEQLVAQRRAALGLDDEHEAPGLEGAGLVRRKLLVLVAPGAADGVAVEERDGVVGVGLDAVLAALDLAERDGRAVVGLVVKLRRAVGAVRVHQPHAGDEGRVGEAAPVVLDGGAHDLPRRVALREHRGGLRVVEVVVDHARRRRGEDRWDAGHRWRRRRWRRPVTIWAVCKA